LQGERAF